MSVKINRIQLMYLLDIIKCITSEAYMSFKNDNVKISIFGKNTVFLINIDYESYVYDNETTVIFSPGIIDKLMNLFLEK